MITFRKGGIFFVNYLFKDFCLFKDYMIYMIHCCTLILSEYSKVLTFIWGSSIRDYYKAFFPLSWPALPNMQGEGGGRWRGTTSSAKRRRCDIQKEGRMCNVIGWRFPPSSPSFRKVISSLFEEWIEGIRIMVTMKRVEWGRGGEGRRGGERGLLQIFLLCFALNIVKHGEKDREKEIERKR